MPNLAELLEDEEEGGEGGAAAGEAGRRSDGAALLARASVGEGLPGAGSGSPPHKYARKGSEAGEAGEAGAQEDEEGLDGYVPPPPPRPSSVAETDVAVLQARVRELQTQVRGWPAVSSGWAGWFCLHSASAVRKELLPRPTPIGPLHSQPSHPPLPPPPRPRRTTSCSGSWTT